jgi:putative aminopeptidase FrvX
VAAAAREAPAVGETIYVISAQSTFGWSGLSAAIARLGEVDTLVVASARFGGTESVQSSGAVLRRVIRAPFKPIPALRLGTTIALAVRSSFGGTLAESVRAADMAEYATAVARVSGITGAAGSALPVPPLPGAAPRPAQAAQRDSLTPAAALLTTLTDTYGVSGNEGAVREAIRAALPTWAQSRAQIDTAGNLIVALGPERDTVVFMAHMDEIGFAITGIARDGKVSLRRLGGFFPFLWEGQPALLHLERDGAHTMLPGVFVPRDSGNTREPRELTAWFGLDSAALVARGAAIGSTLTGYKSATRLASTRFTNRSIDDRAGCTALILALRAIDPEKLGRKVIFVWSVREEIGLEGAAAMANSLGAPIRRVHAVDTFVSSDSPLESRRFAYAPIGRGAVVRALDNSSATPPSQVDSVVAVARRAGIPLQVGTTNGGNDGSEFVRYGTPDVPIAWPLRYSHSPAELIDLADVAALGRLVAALAMQ